MRYFLVSSFLSLLFSLFSLSCAESQSIDEAFYKGLTDKENAISHFERALASRNVYIRSAAAQELAVLMAEGTELSSGTMRRMKQHIQGHWKTALDSVNDKEKALSFLLNIDNNITDEARYFVLNKTISLFNNHELALIYGHHSVFRYRYNEALSYFGTFKKDGKWPETLPEIFFKYPDQLSDLGRAFQFTASAAEGMTLFLEWEKNLDSQIASMPAARNQKREQSDSSLTEARYRKAGDCPPVLSISNPERHEVAYRLLFFAARTARRLGHGEDAMDLFEKSMAIAPTPEQKDACIWYILDLSLSNNIDLFLKNLSLHISDWHWPNYFNDILERALQLLANRQDWDNIIRAYRIIKNLGGSVKSGYAWVIYRIIEEGYQTKEQPAEKTDYLLNCYNSSQNDFSSFSYYHAVSAEALKIPMFRGSLHNPPPSGAVTDAKPSPALFFIMGFFIYNAQDYALGYIHELENELSIEELRASANLLEKNGLYPQVIRLVTRYMRREGYLLNRRDVELLFPVPFKELVDKYAAEYDIAPEILFGLIRTESAFQHEVVSHAGAVGLAQLLPDTAEEMAGRLRRAGGPDYTRDNFNLTDPEQNIHLGAYYLNYLKDRFEDDLLSLLAYNGGMNRIRRLPGYGILPPDIFMETVNISETRDYGRKVLGAAAVYKVLYY